MQSKSTTGNRGRKGKKRVVEEREVVGVGGHIQRGPLELAQA